MKEFVRLKIMTVQTDLSVSIDGTHRPCKFFLAPSNFRFASTALGKLLTPSFVIKTAILFNALSILVLNSDRYVQERVNGPSSVTQTGCGHCKAVPTSERARRRFAKVRPDRQPPSFRVDSVANYPVTRHARISETTRP